MSTNPFADPNYGIEEGEKRVEASEQVNPYSDPNYGRESDWAVTRGFKKSGNAMATFGNMAISDNAAAAERIRQAHEYAQANPGSAESQELMQAFEKGDGFFPGLGEMGSEVAKDWNEAKGFVPKLASVGKNIMAGGELLAEQIGNMAAPMVGMAAGTAAGSKLGAIAGAPFGGAGAAPGAAIGGVGGGVLGAGVGNAAQETGFMAMDEIYKAGIDPNDVAAVQSYLDEHSDRLLKQGATKGVILGAVDRLTMGIASKLLNGPTKAAVGRAFADMGVDATNKAAVKTALASKELAERLAADAAYQASRQGAQKAARNMAAFAVDPAGEFSGEYFGTGVATGEWDTKAAGLEALMGLGQSGVMFAGQKAYELATRPRTSETTKVDPASGAPVQVPATPSESMGINPNDGSLSTAAALAVDSGVSQSLADMASLPAEEAGQVDEDGAERDELDSIIEQLTAEQATQGAPAQQDATSAQVNAAEAARQALAAGGTEADATRAATDSLINDMDANPDLSISTEAPAAVEAAKAASSPKNLRDGIEQAQANAALAEAEAEGAPEDIKAIVAKKIPDMTADELQRAIDHYGPDHKRTKKLEAALGAAQQAGALPSNASQITQAAPTLDSAPGTSPNLVDQSNKSDERATAGGKSVILQNRDRSTPAMVSQMNKIAAAPDYLRAGTSKTMDQGAPVVFGEAPASAIIGRKETITDNLGGRNEVQYAVVEAADLIASNRADGTPNKGYAAGEAGKFRVMAGNGRAAGLEAGYKRGTAGKYRAELEADANAIGVDASKIRSMKEPMLVRVIAESDITQDAGDRSNVPATAQMPQAEQAVNDTQRIDISKLEFTPSGQPSAASVLRFINTMPESERGPLLNPDRTPTRQAIDRVMAATFKVAYGNDELVRLYSQATDPDARTVINALGVVAGDMARLAGTGEYDFREAASQAAIMAVNASRKGVKLADEVENADFMLGEDAFLIAQFMADNIRSGAKIAQGLRELVAFAHKQVETAATNAIQSGMFGDAPTLTRPDVLAKLKEFNDELQRQQQQQQAAANAGGLFGASPEQSAEQPAARQERQPTTGAGKQATASADGRSGEGQPEQVAASQPQATEKTEKTESAERTGQPEAWRGSYLSAAKVARDLGVDPKQHKKLDELLAAIDAKQQNDQSETVADDRKRVERAEKAKNKAEPKQEAANPQRESKLDRADAIVTDAQRAAAEKLKRLLDSRRGQVNSGIDPELLLAVAELGALSLAKGTVKFAVWVRDVIAATRSVGINDDQVKSFLKESYGAIAANPEKYGVSDELADEMDSLRDVRKIDINDVVEEVAQEAHEARRKDGEGLYGKFLASLRNGTLPSDNRGLRDMVSEIDGQEADNFRLKEAQEILEASMAQYAREVVEQGGSDRQVFERLLDLYHSQPSLNIRTSTSVENQAYSTPVPLAYLAGRLADIDKSTRVYEPTAGNGMLLITARPEYATANELDPARFRHLSEQGFNAANGDALRAFDDGVIKAKSQDAVITNPPFGSVKDANGKATKIDVDGYKIGQIDHLIVAESLKAMKDDGKAAIIIGANKAEGGISTDDRIFFNWLYSNYNVTGHFDVAGRLYNRQGANWPVRVITINGRQQSERRSPAQGDIARLNSWDDVYEQFENILDAQQRTVKRPANGGAASRPQNDETPSQVATDGQGDSNGSSRGDSERGGDIESRSGAGAATSASEPRGNAGEDGSINNEHRSDDGASESDRLEQGNGGNQAESKGDGRASRGSVATEPSGSPLASDGGALQVKYAPRSSRKDEGVLVPINMAQPLQDALARLEDEVGDIDEFAASELGYASVDELHQALMGLQVDSVAAAIHQIKDRNKGVIIADQTGIGKGRQAAAMIRWAHKNGYTPVFVTVKPSLYTDMYGDLADIGTTDIEPFIINSDGWVKSPQGEKLFTNKPKQHRDNIKAIASTGRLPHGRGAMFVTYSQINKDNIQRQALAAVAPNAIFILDESHNAAGDSSTGEYMRNVTGSAKGVVYLSATYAKRPDNMRLYFRTDMAEALSGDDELLAAMGAGGLPLQTVISSKLVQAGQMFRRERSYEGISVQTKVDFDGRAEHEKISNQVNHGLRLIVAADRAFHDSAVKQMKKDAEKAGMDIEGTGNKASDTVSHTEFSSVVHNFVRQMLLGMKAESAAQEAIAALKRGQKPLIALENTMGSFLAEYADANEINVGDPLGKFDYRNVLSRALERTRVVKVKDEKGEESRVSVALSDLDPATRLMYERAQEAINDLDIDLPVSPLDWMRHRIEQAGYSVAEITGRNLAVDYSGGEPVLSQVPAKEQSDKVATTKEFNSGQLDAVILNVSGSTGISLHASERFADQRKRHMIVAQPAQDINIFMQMLGRPNRTGQVQLPEYTILATALPAEKRQAAILSKKMKSLNANTSSNTESATSVNAVDMLNKYGDQVVTGWLVDNPDVADEISVPVEDKDGNATDDIARKVTGRMALLPVEQQDAFYAEIESQYNALIEYLDETGQNDLEPKTLDFEAKLEREATLVEGRDPNSPFGDAAVYGEYKIKPQGKMMTPDEVQGRISQSLDGQTAEQHANAIIKESERGADPEVLGTGAARDGKKFIMDHRIGSTWRVEINGDHYNAVVTNIRSTHKSGGNPHSLSKIQVTIAVNGTMRSTTVPASQWGKIEVAPLVNLSVKSLFSSQVEGSDKAKIITGNLLAAYGELKDTKSSIISFTKADGSVELGILLPKNFRLEKNTQGDFAIADPASVLKVLHGSSDPNMKRFGVASRDGSVRVLPLAGGGITISVPRSKRQGSRYFLNKNLTDITSDFVSKGSMMVVSVPDAASANKAIGAILNITPLYALPSMANDARAILGVKQKEWAPDADGAVGKGAQQSSSAPRSSSASGKVETWEGKHTKTGEKLFLAKPSGRVDSAEYSRISNIAKNYGGFWDRFSKGFRFGNEEARAKFVGELSPSDSGVKFSRAAKPTGSTVASIRGSLKNAYGRLIDRLEATDKVKLAQTIEQAVEAAAKARSAITGQSVDSIKQSLMASVSNQVARPGHLTPESAQIEPMYSSNGDVEGFYDPQSGVSVLIADALTAETAPGTLMHEVGVHMAADGESMTGLFERAQQLLDKNPNNPFIKRVQQRMDEAGESGGEEAAAYIVTEYENNRVMAPNGIAQLVKDIVAAIRGWLFRNGVVLKSSDLKPADIAAIARANARRIASESGSNSGSGVKRSFAGMTAATADTRSLSAAQERIEAGEDAEAVRKDTGWHKGKDDKWRFEISDDDARLRPASEWQARLERARRAVRVAELEESSAKKARDEVVRERGESPSRPSDATKALPQFIAARQRLSAAKRTVAQAQSELNGQERKSLIVGDVLDHPALFAAYPALADMRLTLDRDMRLGTGHLETKGRMGWPEIVIGASEMDANKILSVMLHEIQHGIQDIEGFATGGSPEGMRNYSIDKSRRIIEAEYSHLPSYKKAVKDGAVDEWVMGMIKATGVGVTPAQAYLRLAGEVEARNTQARQKMTAAERSATPPSATQDVADRYVIVMFNGKAMHNAPMPANVSAPFNESAYRPTVVSWAKNRFGDAIAPNGQPAWQNFVRWFGDSKVVNKDGEPLVMYHGTAKDFSTFDNAKTGANDRGLWGRGHYFASAPTSANSYALRQGDGARVIPAYVSIQNPLVLRTGDDLVTRLPDGTNSRDLIGQNLDGAKIKAIALEGGHDGAAQVKPDGSIGDVVAYSPAQIKSATGNNGDFDGANPDIVFSKSRAAAQTINEIKNKWKRAGIDAFVSERNGVINLLKIVVPKDSRSTGIGTKAMQQLVDYADSTGQRIELTPSADFGGSKSRLVQFYKRFGFVENKGSNKDYAISEAMYRAPETSNIRFSRAAAQPADNTPDTLTGLAASKFDDFVYKIQDKHIDTKRIVQSIKELTGGIADALDTYLQETLFHGRAAKRTKDFATIEMGELTSAMSANGITKDALEEYLHARHAQEANATLAERNPNQNMIDVGLVDAMDEVTRLQGELALDPGNKVLKSELLAAAKEAKKWRAAKAYHGTEDKRLSLSGMSDAEAQAVLNSLTPERQAKMDAVAAIVDNIIAKTRQEMVDYGLESQDTVDEWSSQWNYYIPLMREQVEDEHGGMRGVGQGISVKGREVKGRVGSNKQVVDILANIALQRERTIVRGEKNRVAQSLIGLARLNPLDGFWSTGKVPMIREIDPATGLVRSRPDRTYRNKANAVVAKFDGKEVAVLFDENNARAMRMAGALKNLDAAQLEGLMGAVATGTRYLASVNTQYNPIFGVTNLVRDIQHAMLAMSNTAIHGNQARILGRAFTAVGEIFAAERRERKGKRQSGAKGKSWEEFQNVGGQTGYRDQFANSAERGKAIEKALNPDQWMESKLGKLITADGRLKAPMSVVGKAAGWLLDLLSDYNTAMENGVRLAAYEAGIDAGLTKERAAELAKNLTVNFNRKGQATQQIGAMYAFFNAAVQGTARIGESLFEMEPGKPKTARLSKTGKAIFTGGVLVGSMQAIMLAAAGFDEDEPPEFIRERNLIIPTGGKSYITIPMPLGYHVITNLGRIPTEFALGGGKNLAKHMGSLMDVMADVYNPLGGAGLSLQSFAPTVADPFVALAENKDFGGRPIARESFDKTVPGHQLARDTASLPATWLAQGINYVTGGSEFTRGEISPTPDQIDYLAGQLTGGVGRELTKVSKTAQMTANGDEWLWHNVPLFGRFLGSSDTSSGKQSAYYSAMDDVRRHAAEVKGLRNSGRGSQAVSYISKHPEATLHVAANLAEKQVKTLRDRVRDMNERGASREEVRAVEQQMVTAMERFTKLVKEKKGD